MPFWVISPSVNVNPSRVKRVCSSAQMRSSDQASRSSSGVHCRYSRLTVGERIDSSAKPRSWLAYTSSSDAGGASARMPSQANG